MAANVDRAFEHAGWQVSEGVFVPSQFPDWSRSQRGEGQRAARPRLQPPAGNPQEDITMSPAVLQGIVDQALRAVSKVLRNVDELLQTFHFENF